MECAGFDCVVFERYDLNLPYKVFASSLLLTDDLAVFRLRIFCLPCLNHKDVGKH